MYGLGAYVSAAASPSVGYLIGIFIHLLIIVFYAIDLIFKDGFTIRINWVYFLMVLLQLMCVVSLFVSLHHHMPGTNKIGVVTKSIMLVLPFHAYVCVLLYNEKHRDSFERLVFISLTLLLAINLIGFYGLGLRNETHSIEGRVTFPFLDSFYSGACMLAILNLMLLTYIKRSLGNPWRVTYLIVYFAVNLVLLYLINSRLTLLIFLGVFVLFLFNLARNVRGLFLLSVFMLPILLNVGMLIYKILSLPVFVVLMQRVNLIDVTTFNGRAYLWQRAIDWLLYDQRGLFFGNGTNGHYFLHLVPDIAAKWGVREENTHLHSTVLMTVVDQGLVGYGLLILVCFQMFRYFRREFSKNTSDGIFYSVVVFMIFVMQVDTFVYAGPLGYLILALLVSRVAVNADHST
jgi:O-antigen ligase